MKNLKNVIFISGAIFLAACSTLENPNFKSLPFPHYAMGGFLEDVSVNCGASVIVVSRHAMYQFYTEDDELLTHKEFCETFKTGTYIHRS